VDVMHDAELQVILGISEACFTKLPNCYHASVLFHIGVIAPQKA
jgi:hypothetical protein